MNPDLNKAINSAKIQLMKRKNSVFISTVLFSLKMVITPAGHQIDTAATDGVYLWINEPYFLSLSPEARIGLLFHEAWHVCWNHMARGKGLNQKKYNYAGDYVINNMAVASGITLPQGALIDKKYRGMSTREVYDIIPDPPEGDQKYCDIIFDDKSTPEEKQVALTNVLIRAMTQAKIAGDAPGSIPEEIAVQLDEILSPVLPWQVLLQNYMADFAKEDFTWSRPNRRYMPEFYLPSAYSEALGHIAVAVDTSGSVSNAEFASFISEIHGIKETMNPEKITVIDFDTTIKQIRTINEDENITDLAFTGRGGTNIAPVWDWIKKEKPLVTLIFSDMHFTLPVIESPTPVIWICVNNAGVTMPFGTTIHFTTPRN